jgi:Xaa-Pro aminopeptidase
VRQWYLAVLEALAAAKDALKAGVTCGAIDAAARNVLQRKGLGRYFVHSTGH